MTRHSECEPLGCLALPACQRECQKAEDEAELPDDFYRAYVYARYTSTPTQLAHLPNAKAYEARYREVFLTPAPAPESKPPRWNSDAPIPAFLRKGTANG